MNIDEKIQQALNAPDDCGYARLAKDLARFLQEVRTSAVPAPVASRGCLEWLKGSVCWFLVLPGETNCMRAFYGAAEDLADSWKDGGLWQSWFADCESLDAAVRQIVARATADGYEVPSHPEGLGQ